MTLDIRTLIFVLGLTHVIQFVVFIHQYVVNRTICGVGWWLLWSGVEVLAFTFMLLRGIPSIQSSAIIAQNCLLILGVIFLYIGILRFLGQMEDRRFLALLYTVFIAVLCYFLYFHDDINARGAMISATLAIIAFLSGWALLAYKTSPVAASANFLATVFITHACYFSFRLVVQLAAPPADFFAPTLFNWSAFVDAIIVGNLWTFGTILMINQQLNAEMKKAKEEMELVFNTSPDAVLISRLSDGMIVNVNDGFLALSGFTRDECLGKTTLAVNTWKHPADREAVVNELREKGRCRSYEAVFQRKNGIELCGLMSAEVFNLQGAPHVISVTQDITERKRLEREHVAIEMQLRHQQKLKSLGTLASGVAHEINNPINGAMNYAQLIQDRLPPDSPLVEYTREILHETERVATIARNLLAFAQNENNFYSIDRIADVIDGVLSLIRAVIQSDQITLTVNVPSDLPQFKCRRQQIQHVLMNLLTNGRDALNARYPGHDPDKVLSIGASLFEKADCRRIRVTVEDHGTGITPEVRERMFDPFYTTKDRTQCTGLGLAISHGIVQEHHGELTVESEPGKLTRMHMDLPVDNGWKI